MPHSAKFWVKVKAARSTYGAILPSGLRKVEKIRAVNLYANKPSCDADEEAVEIEIVFPDGYFDENAPKVVITIPDNVAGAPPPVQVNAGKVKPHAPSAAASVLDRSGVQDSMTVGGRWDT